MRFREFFKGFKEGFGLFGKIISGLINAILLSIVYFIGVGVTSIICRLGGKRFLDLRLDKSKDSYWEKREQNPHKDAQRMF